MWKCISIICQRILKVVCVIIFTDEDSGDTMLNVTDLEEKVLFHPQTQGELNQSTPLE